MEYMWTKSYVNDLALMGRKLDNNVLYSTCQVEASYDKEATLALYMMVKEVIKSKYRRF